MLSSIIAFVFDLLRRFFACFFPPPEEVLLPYPVSSRQLRSILRQSVDWGPYQSFFRAGSHKSSDSASSCGSHSDQGYGHIQCDSLVLTTPPTSPPLRTPTWTLPRDEKDFWTPYFRQPGSGSLRQSITSPRVEALFSTPRSPRRLLKSLSLPRLSKLPTLSFSTENTSDAINTAPGGMFPHPFPSRAQIAVRIDVHVASEARATDEKAHFGVLNDDSDSDVCEPSIDSVPPAAFDLSIHPTGSTQYVAHRRTRHLSITTVERDAEAEILAVSKEFSEWRVDLSDEESDAGTLESMTPYSSVV